MLVVLTSGQAGRHCKQKMKECSGTILKLNPTRAQVEVYESGSKKVWNVPYGMLLAGTQVKPTAKAKVAPQASPQTKAKAPPKTTRFPSSFFGTLAASSGGAQIGAGCGNEQTRRSRIESDSSIWMKRLGDSSWSRWCWHAAHLMRASKRTSGERYTPVWGCSRFACAFASGGVGPPVSSKWGALPKYNLCFLATLRYVLASDGLSDLVLLLKHIS
jgi:hypothetical protein